MQKIDFWKMSGGGNDFVLVSGRKRNTRTLEKLAITLCQRRVSVGADGLLYVRRAGKDRVSVRYFNSDASEAFCGNGSRCAAWWAWSRGLVGRIFVLETAAGILPVKITGREKVEMKMPDVAKVSLFHSGEYPRGAGVLHFLDTGVPHAVVPVRELDGLDVQRVGRSLRYNKVFAPAGTNVDFVSVGDNEVRVRTYERGVEAETLACGTGITAAAVALTLSGAVTSPITLVARSGARFLVSLKSRDGGATDISIEGPARVVFKGEIYVQP